METSSASEISTWHEELSAASAAISPLTVSSEILLDRAEKLRAVKRAPHQASLWFAYLSKLNEERKHRIHHNSKDTALHMRMHQALQTVYERATRIVPMSAANRHSQVYLQLWLDLAALRAESDPDEAVIIFKHLKSHRIGQTSPFFWNSWADLEIRQGNKDRAARFRREASICSTNASTPSRNHTPSAACRTTGQIDSVLRSSRARKPLRPPRRVAQSLQKDPPGKEALSVVSPQRSYDHGRTALSGKASATRAGHTPFRPRGTPQSQLQSRNRGPELTSSKRGNPQGHLEGKSVEASAQQNVPSPEILRSQQHHPTARSPPQLFSPQQLQTKPLVEQDQVQHPQTEQMESEEQLRHAKQLEEDRQRLIELERARALESDRQQQKELERAKLLESDRKRQMELESARIFEQDRQRRLKLEREKQLEEDRQREIEHQRLRESSLQRERERTLQREYEQERNRKYARDQADDIARHRERQAISVPPQGVDYEMEKKRQLLRDHDYHRYGHNRKSEDMSPHLQRDNGHLASDQRYRGSNPIVSKSGINYNGSDGYLPELPRTSGPQGERENISPPLRHTNGGAMVDDTPSTTERPSTRGSSTRARPDGRGDEFFQDPKTPKLNVFFRSVQAEEIVTVHGRLYVLLEMVGKGGSSRVYKVLGSDMRIYALKRVRVPMSSSFRATLDSYANEIALLKKLRAYPTIIQLYDAEVRHENGLIQLIMEYGDVDLAKHLLREKGKKVNENLRRAYWQQMLEAVHTIHEARIIHGDLKPANFLIVSGSLKLIDFGIAKAIQTDDTTKIVRESQVGTPNYMSPEALSCDVDEDEEDDETGESDRGSGRASRPRRYKVGRASDIWSLGCILYQMMYGRAPFAHIKNTMQKLQAIQNPGHKISFRCTDDPYVIEVLKGCLERNPDKRMPIPELLKHSFIYPESESRRCLSENEVTTTMTTLTDARQHWSAAVDFLEKRGYLNLEQGKESSEKLISEMIRELPLGLMHTETGLSARRGRNFVRGAMTPTTSGFTGSQI